MIEDNLFHGRSIHLHLLQLPQQAMLQVFGKYPAGLQIPEIRKHLINLLGGAAGQIGNLVDVHPKITIILQAVNQERTQVPLPHIVAVGIQLVQKILFQIIIICHWYIINQIQVFLIILLAFAASLGVRFPERNSVHPGNRHRI